MKDAEAIQRALMRIRWIELQQRAQWESFLGHPTQLSALIPPHKMARLRHHVGGDGWMARASDEKLIQSGIFKDWR